MDYQATAAYLRDYRSAGQVSPPQVTPEARRHATDYAALCEAVNERLRQCSVFLLQGLRSEAIQLAEEVPNLLDMVAALDLPDFQAWVEFCQQNDLPIPSPLQIERAEQLNAAYAADQPLEQLLNRHRRLALARSPIRHRLQILREIHAIDPQSVWEKDIRTFEYARLRELKSAFGQAARDQDRERMLALSNEVSQTRWLEPVPDDLRAAATQTEDHVKMLHLNAELEVILDKLRQAYGARSLTQTSVLMDKTRTLLEAHKSGVSAEVAAELKPIMEWMKAAAATRQRDQAFDHAAQELRALLDSDAPDSQLEGAYQKVREFNRPAPRELDERYQQTLARRTRTGQRRQRTVLLVIAAIVLLAAAAGWGYLRLRQSTDWASRIRSAVAARNVVAAERLIEEQKRRAPQFSGNADVVEAIKQTEALREQYNRDAAAIKAAIDAAADPIAQANAATDSTPIDRLVSLRQIASDAADNLERVKQWAWADPNNEIGPKADQARAARDGVQAALSRKAMAEVAATTTALDAVPSSAAEVEPLLATLDALTARLASIRNLPAGNDQAIAAASDLLGRIDRRRQDLQAQRSQSAELMALRNQATGAAAWKTALELFTAAHPQAAITGDFQRALKAIAHDEAIETWQKLAASWTDLAPANENAAKQRLNAVRDFMDKHPGGPVTAVADRYATYLTQAAAAMAMDGTWQNGLAGLLSQPLITDLKYFDSSDGQRYYVMGDPNLMTRRLNEQVFVTFEVIDPKNLAKRLSVTIKPPAALVNNRPLPVPHARFAETLAAQLKMIGPDNWDTWGLDMADLLMKDEQIVPAIKAAILLQLLTVQRDVDAWSIGTTFDRTIDEINRQRADQIVWYDPDRPVSQATLDALKKLMDNAPKPAEVKKKIEQAKAALFRATRMERVGTGVLMRAGGGMEVFSPGSLPLDALAVAALPTAGTTRPEATLIQIGNKKDGKLTIDQAAAASLPQGSLVYFLKP